MEIPVFVQHGLIFIAGLITSCILIGCIQSLSHRLYPVDIDFTDREALKRVPTICILSVEVSYAVGSFGGGLIIGILSNSEHVRNYIAIAVGCLLTVFGFGNVVSFWHPMWFILLSTLTYVPACYLGALQGDKVGILW